MTVTKSTIRKAAIEGLYYAAYLAEHFGWSPASPEPPHMGLLVILNLAAGKTAVANGESVHDVQALMGYLLCQHLEIRDMHAWEAEPGRTATEVSAALRLAAA